IEDAATDKRSTTQRERLAFVESRDRPEVSPLPEDISFDSIDVRVARTTYPSRALGDRVKDRLNLGWRGGDHPQDFARCGLPLQGLFGLVEQAHVLYRDRGLVGERFAQTDLLGREGGGFGPSRDEQAAEIVVALQR